MPSNFFFRQVSQQAQQFFGSVSTHQKSALKEYKFQVHPQVLEDEKLVVNS